MKMTQSELAAKLKTSVTTLRNWVISGMPHEKNKKGRVTFELKKVMAWLEKKGKKGETNEKLKQARLAGEIYSAKLAEHKYKKKISQHVRAEDVEHAAKSFKTRLQNRMREIPKLARKALETSGAKGNLKEVEKIISREIELVLCDE
ncbi:MAG: hypothetical protein MRK02_05640 [Candidatus Scalindua sp.]|nr:hypothetical protein [Candidatus Scalindua sp.]